MARQFGTKQKAERAGDVRQSQLITTFGIGSMVDFVQDTVIIGGVDNWDNDIHDESQEHRILRNNNLQAITGTNFFIAPKTANNTGFNKSADVESFIFPRKQYCPFCTSIIDAGELGSQQRKYTCYMEHFKKPDKACGGRFVASRFVIICNNGHIEDFPYSWWVHHGNTCVSGKTNPRIKMFNYGNRSDIDSLMIKCEECETTRPMAGAFAIYAFGGEHGYRCNGRHPHLGLAYKSECDQVVTARIRSSSSVYFPANMSALTIPPWSGKAVQAVESSFDLIREMEEYGDDAVRKVIKTQVLKKVSAPFTLDDLVAAYELIKNNKASSRMMTTGDVFASEYDVLCRGTIRDDEYIASVSTVPLAFRNIFDSITVIEKLTVVSALVGFTRINPWDGTIGSPQLAPLSREKKNWLPAVKMFGEGIFIRFSKKALVSWYRGVKNRYELMAYELERSFYTNERFSPMYVAMHTFAHLLIRQLSEDCGYSTSSLKEKIYASFINEPNLPEMHGVLIYLSTSDSEGSLGGLISIGKDPKRLQAVLCNMLQKAMWCSADPLCANTMEQGVNSLNYAACHDCVLLPETSCEFRNVLLDRIAVVGTDENPEMGLFGSIAHRLLKG